MIGEDFPPWHLLTVPKTARTAAFLDEMLDTPTQNAATGQI
jgi:hypothetical protein